MIRLTKYYKSLAFIISSLFISFVCFAQDKKVDVDINVDKGNNHMWYTNPIVWIIGGAVFILLLVALLGNRSKA